MRQQVGLDLHHLLGARGGPLGLLSQLLAGIVVVGQVVVGQQLQRFDQRGIPGGVVVVTQLGQHAFDDQRPDVLAVHGEAAVPGEVVQPQRLQLSPPRRDGLAGGALQQLQNVHLGGDGHVADADCRHVRRVAGQRFRHQAGRVGEVDQQRARRQLAHVGGQIQQNGDGAQRLGHAADAGGLLADQVVPLAQVFITLARLHPAHPQLCGHVAGAGHACAAIGRQMHLEGRSLCRDHALGKAADHSEPLRVDVNQPQFGHGEAVDAVEKALDKLRRVAGAAADDCNFHACLSK